uniref:Uncharacterized protein n=1 Tax=Panagrolaimus superbus TaxID=310955 RepID=A0A914YKE2_9BILA
MAKLQVVIVCLLVVSLASFCVEAHFFGTFDNEFKDPECSTVDVRTCEGDLLRRLATLCANLKPPPFYKDKCDKTTIAGKCCGGGGCSDCYLEKCC